MASSCQKPLTDQGGKTGFYYDGKGMALHFDNSGFQAKNVFIKYAEITITSIKKVIC